MLNEQYLPFTSKMCNKLIYLGVMLVLGLVLFCHILVQLQKAMKANVSTSFTGWDATSLVTLKQMLISVYVSLKAGSFDKVSDILKFGFTAKPHWKGMWDIYLLRMISVTLKLSDMSAIFETWKANFISVFCRMVPCFTHKPRGAYKPRQTLTMGTQHHCYDLVPTRTIKNGSSKKEVDPDVA